MRAWHLMGLKDPQGKRLQVRLEAGEPFFVPSLVAEEAREFVLGFLQCALSSEVALRIEVDFFGDGLLPSDREVLRRLRDRCEGAPPLLVVRVRDAGVDLDVVVATDEVRLYDVVAVSAEHPMGNERLGPLLALCQRVRRVVDEQYRVMANELGLDPGGFGWVRAIVETLACPVEILEAANSVVSVQLEGVAVEQQREAAMRRVTRGASLRAGERLLAAFVHRCHSEPCRVRGGS